MVAQPENRSARDAKLTNFSQAAESQFFPYFFGSIPRQDFETPRLREFIKSCYDLGNMSDSAKPNVILTSSFNTVVQALREKALLPKTASVAFIPTAGDPYPERPWIDADRKALVELGYSVTDIDLKGVTTESLKNELSSHDIIFVAGGNTTYLVQQSHTSGFADLIRDFLKQGKLYVGSSAGSILAGPTVEPFITEDLSELPKNFVLTKPTCLHLVDYVVLPHDQVEQFAAEHNKIIAGYSDRFTFVRLTDQEYRVKDI